MLKYHMYLRRGARNQIAFLRQYSNQRLMVKAFKGMRKRVYEAKDREYVMMMYINRGKLRKVWRALLKNRQDRFIGYPSTNGPFLKCCEIMLRASFGSLMDTVWQEFPKQKISVNHTSGHQHHLLNYLGLSRNPRYR